MLLDRISAFIARYRGLPAMIAVLLVIVNFTLGFFPGLGWLATSNVFLHLGIVVGFIGLLLAQAVG